MDLEMEVERLRAMEAYQNRDLRRREEQQRGAAILREQLAERERQRVEAEELRDLVGSWQAAAQYLLCPVVCISQGPAHAARSPGLRWPVSPAQPSMLPMA